MERKTCFLVCPIGEEGTETRQRSDTLLEYLIKPVCQEKGYDVVRADQIYGNDRINDTIIDYLDNADLVIADVTDNNPNVFYELGYRTATKKPIVQIALNGSKLPFDISIIRTYFYDLDLKKSSDTKQHLIKTIYAVEEKQKQIEEEEKQKKQNELLPIEKQQEIVNLMANEIVKNPMKLKEYENAFSSKRRTTTPRKKK